jgi:hypothetical protein
MRWVAGFDVKRVLQAPYGRGQMREPSGTIGFAAIRTDF